MKNMEISRYLTVDWRIAKHLLIKRIIFKRTLTGLIKSRKFAGSLKVLNVTNPSARVTKVVVVINRIKIDEKTEIILKNFVSMKRREGV